MKFSCQVDIKLPLARVSELFDNSANMKYWQDGFESYNPISPNPDTVGAQAEITYRMRNKTFTLTETILHIDLPHAFHGSYEGDFGKNTMKNYFVALDEQNTRWRADLEYLEARGFMMKVMTRLMPGVMKKQTQKWLNQFKQWAENLNQA